MSEPIQDKTAKPAGLLPKHIQSWLILGLAILMVLIMWLTGAKRAPLPAKSKSFVPGSAPVEVNEAKIVELQTRIQQLQREQAVAQSALTQQARYLAATPEPHTAASANGSGGEHAEDAIQAERKKREYLSLFASN